MKNILIIGGTRNMGHSLTLRLLEAGHRITLLNREVERLDLPESVHYLRVDRADAQQLRRALLAKSFQIVVDFAMDSAREAETIVELLQGSIEHYIFISTGQVYLVRENIERPFSEDAYEGRLLPSPKINTFAFEEWRYGMDKRAAEDVFARASAECDFPYTSLRLPMVNGERDPFKRLYNYILRIRDGGPILVPETPNYPLRHVYAADVIQTILTLIETGKGKGRAYNICQYEAIGIDEFIALLGELMELPTSIVRFKRSELEANGFLPDCSPFSERWMSELDNTLSKEELGIEYTPLRDYLARLIAHYESKKPSIPVGYKRRSAELHMAKLAE